MYIYNQSIYIYIYTNIYIQYLQSIYIYIYIYIYTNIYIQYLQILLFFSEALSMYNKNIYIYI